MLVSIGVSVSGRHVIIFFLLEGSVRGDRCAHHGTWQPQVGGGPLRKLRSAPEAGSWGGKNSHSSMHWTHHTTGAAPPPQKKRGVQPPKPSRRVATPSQGPHGPAGALIWTQRRGTRAPLKESRGRQWRMPSQKGAALVQLQHHQRAPQAHPLFGNVLEEGRGGLRGGCKPAGRPRKERGGGPPPFKRLFHGQRPGRSPSLNSRTCDGALGEAGTGARLLP